MTIGYSSTRPRNPVSRPSRRLVAGAGTTDVAHEGDVPAYGLLLEAQLIGELARRDALGRAYAQEFTQEAVVEGEAIEGRVRSALPVRHGGSSPSEYEPSLG
jgi:hypothetical protein